MYKFSILSRKCEVITPFYYSMIPVDCFENYKYLINSTSDDMVAIYEDCAYNKFNTIYLT